jgi:hypothetical protein
VTELMPGLRIQGTVLVVDVPTVLAAAAGWPDDPAHHRRLRALVERTARRCGATSQVIDWTSRGPAA